LASDLLVAHGMTNQLTQVSIVTLELVRGGFDGDPSTFEKALTATAEARPSLATTIASKVKPLIYDAERALARSGTHFVTARICHC
jgi:hypothetical protein